jgi:hypothetical protein
MALEDNQKIGIGLVCLGLGFMMLGVLLFFDSALIAIGNALFLAGQAVLEYWYHAEERRHPTTRCLLLDKI